MPRLRLTFPLSICCAAASGVLLFAANPPLGWWPLAFLALVPLLLAFRGTTPMRGAVLGATFGVVYLGLLLYWLALFGELAWGGLVAVQSLFLALFGLLVPVVTRDRGPLVSGLAIAAAWVAVESARSSFPLGGFGWGAPAYSQAADPWLMRLAPLTGAWGMSFVVVAVNAWVASALSTRSTSRGRGVAVAVAACLVVVPFLVPVHAPSGPTVDVAVVQITVPKGLALEREAEIREVAARHFRAHGSLARSAPRPDLVVWAEDALDIDPTRDPELGEGLRQALATLGVPTLLGAITGPPQGPQSNELLLFDAQGELVDRRAKSHLVPFGEYVPFREQLSFLDVLDQIEHDLVPGTEVRPLTLDEMRIADLICFENLFPQIARSQVADGGGFIVVPSNNSAYLASAASEQHLAITRVRAAENARWAAHASISGISAFVSPTGEVFDRTDLFQPTVIRRELPTSTSRTPYNRFGDWFAWASVWATVGLVLFPARRKRAWRAVPDLPERPRTLVLLPTYNERATILDVVERLLALPHELDLLIIDDDSPDGTADAVEALGHPRARVLRRPKKSGLASAYLTGFQIVSDEGYDLAVEMDSDLSHDPDELPRLLDGARTNHLTIGSRYIPGGSVTNWGALRKLLSRAGNLYARLCLAFPLTDSTSGFRVFHRELLEEEVLHRGIHSEGYGFQIELAFRSWRDGWVVGEAPITFREREHGHSKISRAIVIEALWEVTLWGLRYRFGRQEPQEGQRP